MLKTAVSITAVVTAIRFLSRLFTTVATTFSEFEFVMAKVNAVSGATAEEFKALTATAEELGRTTFFTAEQVGQLQLAYSKLGFTAREMQDAVKPTLDLATATDLVAKSVFTSTDALRRYGIESEGVVGKKEKKFNGRWTKQLGTSSHDWGNGVTTDSSGNIYVTGYTDGGLDGNTTSGGTDIILVKYNSSGIKQWTKQ